MSTHRCCQGKPTGDGVHQRGTWLRRARKAAGWLLPGTALALLPKCPMCLAAYVALGTGFAMSPASANTLLRSVTALCIGALAFCAAGRMMKHLRQKHPFNLQANLQTANTPQ